MGKLSNKSSSDFTPEKGELIKKSGVLSLLLEKGLITNTEKQIRVANYVFWFLPQKDILKRRLACPAWITTSEPLIRKQTIVDVKSLQPATFFSVFEYSFTNFPFTSFPFFNRYTDSGFCNSDTEKFFDTLGKSIRKLNLNNVALKAVEHPGKYLKRFDIKQWIEKASNLIKLKIDCMGRIFDCQGLNG